MSFWENNKGTFKAAGHSFASGTKAVGKAGVRTYKKNEAKRKGVEYDDPYPQESKSGETYTPYEAKPLPPKEQLLAYQPPPKRNVAAHAIPKRGESSEHIKPAVAVVSTSQVQQPQVQQPQVQQPQVQQPVQYQQPQVQQPVQYQQPQVQQPVQYQQPQVQQPVQYQQPQVQQPVQYQQPQEQQPQEQLPSYSFEPSTQPQPQPQPQPQVQSQIPVYNQSVQDIPSQPVQSNTQIQGQQLPMVQVQPPQRVTAPQLPSRSAVPPSLPSRTSPVIIPNQNSSYVQPVAAQPHPEPEPEQKPVKPKSILPDPTSFAPPPRRVDLPPLRSRKTSQNSAPTPPSISEQSNTSETPVVPIKTNGSESSIPIKKKPPKPKKLLAEPSTQPAQSMPSQQFNLNAFKNPHISQETEDDEYTNPPKPPRPQIGSLTPPPPPMPARRATNEEIAPPMPARRNTNEDIPPPMPKRSQTEAADISHKKAPPPKPLKKPSTMNSSPPPYTNNTTSTPQGDVSNELNNIFQKMNMKKDSDSSVSKAEIKIKPEIAAKPKIKPEIATKPVVETNPIKSKPPVPVHRERTSQKSPTSPPAPPSRNYSRAPVPVPVPVPAATSEPPKPKGPPQLDLELHTEWYAKRDGPLQLPKDLAGSNYKTSFSTGIGFGGKQTFNITVRLKDLSIISYKFEYNNSNVKNVDVMIENFVPSPLENIPTKQELVANHERFGEYVAGWCEHHKGKTVGRGECWDLAKEALQKGCGNYAFVSTYVIHGYPILQVANSGSGIHFINSDQQLDEIRRGDILQFKTCTFFNPATGVTSTCGQPDHTAIVVRKDGDKLILLEQNSGGRRYVVDGECIIKKLDPG